MNGYDEALYWTGIKIDNVWRSVKEEKKDIAEKEQRQEEIATIEEEQQVEEGEIVNNGSSEISYNGYTYLHMYDEENQNIVILKRLNGSTEQEKIITYKSERGTSHYNLWIYNDKLYYQVDNMLKCCDLDGKNDKNITEVDSSADVQIDIKRGIAIYGKINEDSFEIESIEVAKLDGTKLKTISLDADIGYLRNIETNNLDYEFFTSSKSNEKDETTCYLYMLNKDNYEFTKITSEDLHEGWYGCGIYQAEPAKDYVYYIAGSQEGTGGYFNGSAYRVKKDGTGKEKLELKISEIEGFSENVVPALTVTDKYVYYSGNRINVETNKIEAVQFENGDAIDEDENIYTVSMSTSSKIILAKYKIGTDLSEAITLFSKEIPEGAFVDTQKIKLKTDKKYIYVTINYTDQDNKTGTRAWLGVDYKTETYRIKKDGSEVNQIQ